MNINFSNHIESLANRFGDQEAIVNIERNRRYTFAEFHLLSNRIVNMMMATLGLGIGDRFVNILDNDNLSLIHAPLFSRAVRQVLLPTFGTLLTSTRGR